MTRFVTFASRALIASSLFAVPVASFAQTGTPATPAPGGAVGGAPNTMPDAKAGTPAAAVTSPSAVPEKTQAHAGTTTHGTKAQATKAMPKEHVSRDTSHSTAKTAPAPTHGQMPAKTGGAS